MSLIPDKTKLLAWRGGTFRKQFTLYTGATETPGTERNLTGYTARMIIEDDAGATLKELTTTNGGITLGGTAGTIDLFISDEDTAAATWDSGTFQLFITNAAGDTDPLVYGAFHIQGV